MSFVPVGSDAMPPDIMPSGGGPVELPPLSQVIPASAIMCPVIIVEEDTSPGHVSRKLVKEGKFKLNAFNAEWLNTRIRLEADYVDFAREHGLNTTLPWELPLPCPSRNTCKCIYMSIMMHFGNNVVSLNFDTTASPSGGDGKAFFQIMAIYVIPEKRQEFDSGMFPTVSSFFRATDPAVITRKKTLFKQWQTAGFDEVPEDKKDPSRGVWFVFKPETFLRQKMQQSPKRRKVD